MAFTGCLASGVHVYATVAETLEVEDLATLTGMVFCEAAGADLALISLNEYQADVSSRYENASGMTYTHGNSYASCMQVLEETGNSIANASLNGTEYYLCLHRMVDTDWVLLLAIPAQYVATKTQILVNSVVKTLLFAGLALVVVFVGILVISMRMQQQAHLYRQEQENSAKLEKSRQEAEASKRAAEEAFQVAESANKAMVTLQNRL